MKYVDFSTRVPFHLEKKKNYKSRTERKQDRDTRVGPELKQEIIMFDIAAVHFQSGGFQDH